MFKFKQTRGYIHARSIIFLNNLETQECFLISMFFVVMRLKRTENAGGFIGSAGFRLEICFKFIKYSLMIQFCPTISQKVHRTWEGTCQPYV